MSNTPNLRRYPNPIREFKNIIKEKNKEPYFAGSNKLISFPIAKKKKYELFKQVSFGNNKGNLIERNNHSSMNVEQIKKVNFKKNKIVRHKQSFDKNSTTKLLSFLKKSEKTKYSNKNSFNDSNKEKEKEKRSETKKLRFDNFGNLINKQNKKAVHIIFRDQITANSICEEIEIESFKKYNYIKGVSEGIKQNNTYNNAFFKCCIIF